MDYITILGSCRQEPIKDYFSVSSIQDNLNYPHYTKEILQEIRYLKYKNIPNEFTKYCFRNGLVSNCTREILDSEYNDLKEEFDKTTFFLVEIASRISYKWNNLYMHHIAEMENYSFYDRNNIIKEDLTDEEIEDDIIQIKNELYPKPFIIISHFSTYETGKRYELTQLLKKICEKMSIPFLNQSDIVKEHGINILINEPVLAHYNSEGTRIVGNILFNKINEVKQYNDSTIKKYQVYYITEERIKKHSYHGFGDYIRGTIFLYQLFKNNINISLKVNFSNHNISNFLVCDNHVSIQECENVNYLFNDLNETYSNSSEDGLSSYKYIFTNKAPISNIDEECKKFIIKNCLTPTIRFEKKVLYIKNTLNIVDNNYSVIHIRVSDQEIYNEDRLNNILNIILNINKNNKEELVLISSSDIYLSHINLPFIKKTNLNIIHLGLNTTDIKGCENTIAEFMLMTTSKKIYQLSVYSWGTSFSDTVNKIYDVPIEKYGI
jgi:hypothetical protein